jgi:hypothetical protein
MTPHPGTERFAGRRRTPHTHTHIHTHTHRTILRDEPPPGVRAINASQEVETATARLHTCLLRRACGRGCGGPIDEAAAADVGRAAATDQAGSLVSLCVRCSSTTTLRGPGSPRGRHAMVHPRGTRGRVPRRARNRASTCSSRLSRRSRTADTSTCRT